MQPTDTQVQRSLDALRSASLLGVGSLPHPSLSGPPTVVELPPGLGERLSSVPPVRPDRLAGARRWLELGELPEAEDLARRLVGRLVCDRLR